MSLIPKDSAATPEVVTDEAVVCSTVRTIGGDTYYRGRIERRPRASVMGASGSYGAWTAVSMGGTRLDVKPGSGDGAALPADADEITIDVVNGYVYSTTSRTVYVRYEGHGEYVLVTRVPMVAMQHGIAANGVTDDVWVVPVPRAMDVVGYSVNVQPGGYAPGGDMELAVRSARGGGGSALSAETIDLGSGEMDSGTTEFTTAWRVQAGTLIAVRGDGKGIEGAMLTLYGRAA